MFDVSYKTMLGLVKSLRKNVKENPSENNMRGMGHACMETYANRGPGDYDNHSLYLEALYWFRRLNKEYPKEEYAGIVQRMEANLPKSLQDYGIDELIDFLLNHLEAQEQSD